MLTIGFESRTFLLGGDGANDCTAVPLGTCALSGSGTRHETIIRKEVENTLCLNDQVGI